MNARNWPKYVTEKCLFVYFWCCLYPCTVLCCEPPTLWEKKPKVWTQDYGTAEDSITQSRYERFYISWDNFSELVQGHKVLK